MCARVAPPSSLVTSRYILLIWLFKKVVLKFGAKNVKFEVITTFILLIIIIRTYAHMDVQMWCKLDYLS